MEWVLLSVGMGIGMAVGAALYRSVKRRLWLKKNIELARLIRKRNYELEAQKRELEQTYRNFTVLSQIGKELTSSLDFETIFERLYAHINSLTDATYFGVNVFYPQSGIIEYKFMIEKNERLPPTRVSVDDENNLSAACIRNNREIFIQDYSVQYSEYGNRTVIPVGDFTNSIIYVPLTLEDRIIGTVSVQSFKKYAYTDRDLEILRSLASYTAIALSNAFAFKEIEQKNREIESGNLAITDSLHYARRIQEAILPHNSDIEKSLKDFFIFYRPRDIVSGDFYWFTNKGNIAVIAVVDCTGHGVPGAFMSVLGNSLLNQIVSERNVTTPHLILTYLNEAVKQTLKQNTDTSDSNDGMDICLCVVDRDRKKIHYAGANRPLYYAENINQPVKTEKGDRNPIGGRMEKHQFVTHSFDFTEGFTFYLSTDGFTDQFGGETTPKRKFSNTRFKNLLDEILPLPVQEQHLRLNGAFDDWIGNHKQIDDVLVIGIRL